MTGEVSLLNVLDQFKGAPAWRTPGGGYALPMLKAGPHGLGNSQRTARCAVAKDHWSGGTGRKSSAAQQVRQLCEGTRDGVLNAVDLPGVTPTGNHPTA